jgi:hypothetical protein
VCRWSSTPAECEGFVVDSVGMNSFLQIVTSLIIRGGDFDYKFAGGSTYSSTYSAGIYLNI